jgi:hypothetical protein
MKNTAADILKNTFRHIGNHVSELFNPQTPSYKTSLTAAILFGIAALFSGERYSLFWMTLICCLFFGVLSLKQFGLSNLVKRS